MTKNDDTNAVKNITMTVDDSEVNPHAQAAVHFESGKDGYITIILSNPRDLKGKLSSTGKTYVLASGSEKFGDVRINVLAYRNA